MAESSNSIPVSSAAIAAISPKINGITQPTPDGTVALTTISASMFGAMSNQPGLRQVTLDVPAGLSSGNVRGLSLTLHYWPSGDSPAPFWFLKPADPQAADAIFMAFWPDLPSPSRGCIAQITGGTFAAPTRIQLVQRFAPGGGQPELVRWWMATSTNLRALMRIAASTITESPHMPRLKTSALRSRGLWRDSSPIMRFSSAGPSWITPENPHGYNGASRRLDLPEGRRLFIDTMLRPAAAQGAQGIVFWTPGGLDARGARYRFDSWAMPPEVLHGVKMVSDEAHRLGMWVGGITRPTRFAVAETETALQLPSWDKDYALPLHKAEHLDGTLESHRAVASMAALKWILIGADAVYADELGWYHSMLPFTIDSVATGIATFPEYGPLPHAAETGALYYEGGNSAFQPLPDWVLDLYQEMGSHWCVMAAIYRNVGSYTHTWAMNRKLAPLVDDYHFANPAGWMASAGA